MPITDLINLKPATVSDVATIDCAKNSQLLARASYKPVGINGGLAFTYNVVTALPTASTRALGGKPAPTTPTIVPKSGIMKIFTSIIPVDSVFNNAGQDGRELHALASTSALAVANKLTRETFEGVESTDPNTFNGFAKIVTGTATDLTADITPVDVSLECADLQKSGMQLIQAISKARGKMGQFKPNMIIADTETKELIMAALKNTGHIKVATMEELGMDYDKYGNMDFVDVDGVESLKADANGLAYIYLVSWGEDAVRYQVPEGEAGFIKQSMPVAGNGGACVSEGYTQAVAHLVVPATSMVARFKVKVDTVTP